MAHLCVSVVLFADSVSAQLKLNNGQNLMDLIIGFNLPQNLMDEINSIVLYHVASIDHGERQFP